MTVENVEPTAAPDPGTEQQQENEPKENREAAKWRRQLRETETERDSLRSRVEAMQRAEVERLAGDRLAKPESLWKTEGVALADLLGEDGQVDADKVAAATELAASTLGLQQLPAHQRPEVRGAYVPSEGRYPGNPASSPSTWKGFLNGDEANSA